MKQEVLKLNAGYWPIGVADWQKTMVDIVSGSAHPVDVSYEIGEDGKLDKNKIEYLNVIKNFNEWVKLPIRSYDEFVQTPSMAFRIPPIVVCAKFNRIIFKQVMFPTKANIWKRDNWCCQYTGEKLTRENISVDHLIPSSRGGENSWTNLVTCEKSLNVWKSDRTPKECGLKLIQKPSKPKNGLVFDFLREEWNMFLDGGKFN